jgi:hypothetical protein
VSKAVHISKKKDGGWAVKRQGAERDTSVHQTQSEAVAAGRRLALKSGGAEIVVHRADGRVRDRDTVGAAKIDALKTGGLKREPSKASMRTASRPSTVNKPQRSADAVRAASRARRSQGSRTTLRVPTSLLEIADRLAKDLEVSRNDALLRLATQGARLYEQEQRISERRERRWAAVIPGIVDIDQAAFPSAEEARDAVLAARDEVADLPS